jgi:hypothetical protein
MSKTSRRILDITQAKLLPAVVIEPIGNGLRATVRVSNGSIFRNLFVVGGPAYVNLPGQVDFSGSIPVFLASAVPDITVGSTYGTTLDDVVQREDQRQPPPGSSSQVQEGPGIDLVSSTIGLGGDTILLYDSGGQPVAEFAATSAGLDAAIAGAGSGDIVLLPAITVDGNHTVVDGITVMGMDRDRSVLSGLITVGSAAALDTLSVIRTANDANDLVGVKNTNGNNPAYIRNCTLDVRQSGAGGAYCIYTDGGLDTLNGSVDVRYSTLYASSVGGYGYAGASAAGLIYARWCQVYGSTDRWIVI